MGVRLGVRLVGVVDRKPEPEARMGRGANARAYQCACTVRIENEATKLCAVDTESDGCASDSRHGQ